MLSRVAVIEVSRHMWYVYQNSCTDVRPDLIQNLMRNMVEATDANIREATMLAVGYLCEDLPDSVLSVEERNALLTAIVSGMAADPLS